MSSPQPETAVRRPRRSTASITVAALLDVVLVAVFAATGRASHAEDVLAGLWQTAWPFLAGLAVGWVATRAWRAPFAPVRTGLGIWAATVIGGILLRAASGQGTAIAFVIVATVVLLVFLVGWRLIATAVLRGRARRAAS